MTSLSSRIGATSSLLWRDRRQARWAFQRTSGAAYLGWVGRGNLGDEAMYAGVAARWPAGRLRVAPLHRASRAMARGARIGTLVLGGGTLIGRDEWAWRLDQLMTRTRVERLVVLGTGCEDLDRARTLGLATSSGLRRWSSILAQADYVGVRGPDSRGSLAELGVGAEALGDPGLLLGAMPPTTRRAGVVGVNVAAVGDGLGSDRRGQLDAVVDTVRSVGAAGLETVWFSMEKEDEVLARELAVVAGGSVRPHSDDLTPLRQFLTGCDAVVAERLHGGILAMAAGTPAVMLGYKPKCFDFARSVDAQRWIVSLNSVAPADIAGLLVAAAESGLPPSVSDAVERTRGRLAERIDHVARS